MKSKNIKKCIFIKTVYSVKFCDIFICMIDFFKNIRSFKGAIFAKVITKVDFKNILYIKLNPVVFIELNILSVVAIELTFETYIDTKMILLSIKFLNLSFKTASFLK